MIKSNIRKEFTCDKEKLWKIITDNTNYSWRSSLSKVVMIDEENFIEYNKKNYPTYFTITAKEKLKEYRFDFPPLKEGRVCLPRYMYFKKEFDKHLELFDKLGYHIEVVQE